MVKMSWAKITYDAKSRLLVGFLFSVAVKIVSKMSMVKKRHVKYKFKFVKFVCLGLSGAFVSSFPWSSHQSVFHLFLLV